MRAFHRPRGALAATLLLAACHGTAGRPVQTLATPAPEQMRRDIDYLASDALGGRGTGTAGNDTAAAFIAARYNALRLVSIAQPERAACTQGGRLGRAECFELPFVAKVAARNAPVRELRTQNVAAIAPGTGPLASEYVIVGAHFDHLGTDSVGALDPEQGHVIRNGADDNGSGTVTVMELARRFARNPARRSVLFVNFTGEELGLLGSEWFANHLPVDKSRVQAMVNFDMVGRLRNDKLIIYGVSTATEMKGLLDSANVAPALQIAAVGDGEGPSDHASFYRKDLPVLHLFTDLHDDYHRATDKADKIDVGGMVRIADFAERVIRSLADRPAKLTFVRVQTAGANRPSARQGPGVYFGSIPDMGAADVKGMQLSGVRAGGPADKAGLKGGDIIIRFGARTIGNIYDYTDALGAYKPGDVVDVVALRGGKEVTVKATLTAKP
ncbi:MAG: M28 family peptidase [Gemmatimonadaceae bacterium]